MWDGTVQTLNNRTLDGGVLMSVSLSGKVGYFKTIIVNLQKTERTMLNNTEMQLICQLMCRPPLMTKKNTNQNKLMKM